MRLYGSSDGSTEHEGVEQTFNEACAFASGDRIEFSFESQPLQCNLTVLVGGSGSRHSARLLQSADDSVRGRGLEPAVCFYEVGQQVTFEPIFLPQ